MEAMRCLNRPLSDVTYRQLVKDAQPLKHGVGDGDGAGSAGHCGASQESISVDLPRTSTLRISHFPDRKTHGTTDRAFLEVHHRSSPRISFLTTEGSRKTRGQRL
jgi:hypothetical protein